MKTHEQILSMLAGNSSQQPMQFNALLTISGLQPDTLNMVLDQMYAAHHINQATVKRSGVEQREVWPTGMASNSTTSTVRIGGASGFCDISNFTRAFKRWEGVSPTSFRTGAKVFSSATA